MRRFLLHCGLLLLTCACCHRHGEQGQASGCTAQDFDRCWVVESESDSFRLRFMHDTLELEAPRGLTLWRRECMAGDVRIAYHARVMCEPGHDDRLSDLNCFWKASDPTACDVFSRMGERRGVFVQQYALQLYYMGYGGNHNSTTRFRRYTADARGVTDVAHRPPVLYEYTDSAHLLRPNQWRHIVLECRADTIRYYMDGECLGCYTDPQPLVQGWFGLRTTQARVQLTGFSWQVLSTP